jgi:hypothetical protein
MVEGLSSDPDFFATYIEDMVRSGQRFQSTFSNSPA